MNNLTKQLNQANGRLKAGRVGVRVRQRGQRLCLQATLPPKPGSEITKPHQQVISLGFYANAEGIKQAEVEARIIGSLIIRENFSWEPYIKRTKNPQSPERIEDWIALFEQDYFNRRARTPKSETTWKLDYLSVLRRLPLDKPLTGKIIKDAVLSTDPDTRTRKKFCQCLQLLANLAGIDIDLKPLKGHYCPTRVTPRTIPGDQQIVNVIESIKNPRWQWAIAMLATYGLRPHELFHLDLDSLKQDPGLIVLEGKTGRRVVFPFDPAWYTRFELSRCLLPQCTAKNNSDYGRRVTMFFQRNKLPFRAYDLRHAWAIRTLQMGLEISLASQQMGHSVSVHTSIYHHWISLDVHRVAFQEIAAKRGLR
ncbi:MAG: tyrosine-type recombinase/integrase [Desertifilum sp.]|nr:tyrosine-type recombinase/integrase [Desertifilum sp.]